MEALLEQIASFIDENALFGREDRILVAISGGPDSVWLAYALHHLGYPIGLAHVNYRTRERHSEAEEVLVRRYADTWSVPVFVHHYELNQKIQEQGGSFQLLAREVRYSFFEQLLDTQNFQYCATAHHRDDQLENLLMSLIKGNSPRVFTDIPIKRDRYVRPLSEMGKEQIQESLDQLNLPYSIDASNAKNTYLRNRVRNQVLPLLTELNPSVRNQLANRGVLYQQQYAFIRQVFTEIYPLCHLQHTDGEELNWQEFQSRYGNEHLSLFLDYVLDRWGIHGYERIAGSALSASIPGKTVFTHEGKLNRTRNGIRLYRGMKQKIEPLVLDNIEGSASHFWNGWQLDMKYVHAQDISLGIPDIFYLDSDKISWPVVIRSWQQGDRMNPMGMKGKKKLSDIFIDTKQEMGAKARAVVVADQEEIIALSGYRIAEKVKLSPASSRIIQLTFQVSNTL